MKQVLFALSLLVLTLSWTSCEKVETDPEALDYYKNKNIVLTLTSEDFNEGDNINIKITALSLEDRPNGNPKIVINGSTVEGEYAIINSDLLLDGPITITSTDKAWQYLAEYSLSANGTGYTLNWNSSFNDVAQEQISMNVGASSTKKGIIEIKEYK